MKLLQQQRNDRYHAIEDEAAHFLRHIRHHHPRPFALGDTSTGMEYELQVAVAGAHNAVDLPLTIRQSTYFRNTVKRAARGDLRQRSVDRPARLPLPQRDRSLGEQLGQVAPGPPVRLCQETARHRSPCRQGRADRAEAQRSAASSLSSTRTRPGCGCRSAICSNWPWPMPSARRR